MAANLPHSPVRRIGGQLRLPVLCLVAVAFAAAAGGPVRAQQSSISTWDAADFRIWGFVPYWTSVSGTSVVQQLNVLSAAGTYNHVSDVLYFGGVRPTSTGGLWYHSTATATLNTLQNHAAQHGFRLHMSMFDVAPGNNVDATWTSLVSNQTYRTNFVNNVTNLLQTYGMSGFNFDWERPNTVAKWGNYTQLARELGNVIRPLGMEVSVCDYGGTDYRWDDSPLFDARVYDQLFIMGYHYPAYHPNPTQWNNNNSFADGKLALTGQGPEKAFVNEQLTIGVGTWGTGGPATTTLREFVEKGANIAYNTGTISGTYTAVNGSTNTGTWTIESRQQVREKTQLALDRNMPGMFTWTLHYDALNELGLHRVMHHYAVFQRGIPDLNLDGRVDATDAHILADNMGTVPGWTGTNTAARFDNFYIRGNWERGDRDGNGFVNQADADWLASRFAALGVALPDRLAYTGTFENFADSRGLAGRWQAKREVGGKLRETGNYTQHGAGYLAPGDSPGANWSGSGIGAAMHSNQAVTIRNQNAAERFDNINTLPRIMHVDLETPIDLGQDRETYFTFLVRQNTGTLLSNHLTSLNRTLSLEFLNSQGVAQFDFTFRGLQQELAIRGQADAGWQGASAGNFLPDTTFLFVGKITGSSAGANTIQASLFASGATVGNFAAEDFPWMLTAQSSADFNPLISQLQLTSLFEASYTVSNVWLGTSADFFALPSSAQGDFNGDGVVDAADYVLWRKAINTPETYDEWRANFGATLAAGSQLAPGDSPGANLAAVPEPASLALLVLVIATSLFGRHRCCQSAS